MIYRLYRRLSPSIKLISHNLGLVSGSCRYSPTCSRYTKIAIRRHGLIKGSWISLLRLLKCHPWSSGGYDPVPK